MSLQKICRGGGVKDQDISLFKTKDYSKPESVKTVYRGGKKQSEENITKSIRNIFNSFITEVVII